MDPPNIHVRWWYASHGTTQLELPATPSAKVSPQPWTKLTREESDRCEQAWQALSDEEKLASLHNIADQPVTPAVAGDEEEDLMLGVPIGKERLFEVNVKTMTLYPIFWTGPPIKVRRTLWMHDGNRPVDDPLAQQIEEAYQAIKPWEPSYHDELSAAIQVGAAAYEKLKHPLGASDAAVFFDDAHSARIIYNSFTNRVSVALFGTLRGNRTISPYPAAPLVYRGYDEAIRRASAPSRPVSTSPTRPSSVPPEFGEIPSGRKSSDSNPAGRHGHTMSLEKNAGKNASLNANTGKLATESKVGEGGPQEVTDLILVVHGIGQGLSAQYEYYNFVYMVNLMRIVARKQALSPALNSIMRSHNVQFLPIQWRATLKLDEDESRRRAEDGLDNRFTLADVTLGKHIPMIREISNEVLIDIPYFMSHHQSKMIASVCHQANRAYRLWCARNPSFATKGRVHIVAHSLGAALCARILSSQPTIQPPLSDPIIDIPWNQLLFNVSSLFMIGSPLAVFLHIDQVQLIARKGRERTIHSPPDEALDRTGLFGCMAVDSVYNIFQLTDPIAYKLNPCVDSIRAAELPPIAIPSITGTLLNTFSKGVSKMFDGIINPFAGSNPGPISSPTSESTNFELGGGPNKLQGSRAERRFAALNPHGALDFYLPGEGNFNEYVDMITAHSSYWGDPSLAAFILAEIFARKEDLERTGLGPLSIPNNLEL